MTGMIDDLAKRVHEICIKYNQQFITSWMEFADLREYLVHEDKKFEHIPQHKMLRIMKAGVKMGLFSRPVWRGVGMTPFAGSARRAREWEVLGIKDG